MSISHFHAIEGYFFSLISDDVKECDHLIRYTSGVIAPNLNPAIVHHADSQLMQDIRQCQSYFEHRVLPWALVIPNHAYHPSLLPALQSLSLDIADEGTAMWINPLNTNIPASSNELIIKEISHSLGEWSIAVVEGFESTPEITDVYTMQHQKALLKTNSMFHFTAFLGNEPVSSITVTIHNNLARLDDISTRPLYQHKGYATALILHALGFLQKKKIEACFLEASSDGLNVYKRIGFTELFQNLYFLPVGS
jgi:GNAT superfamily N-acetyltransferase